MKTPALKKPRKRTWGLVVPCLSPAPCDAQSSESESESELSTKRPRAHLHEHQLPPVVDDSGSESDASFDAFIQGDSGKNFLTEDDALDLLSELEVFLP